ncbi:VirK/YbjX family protein [Vibrio metschnikovii]|uniref:VirK/YbjX family protein n=1 Tax=Vibrio metschnikovii TaxID=28172 RepID=UPI002FCAD668
MVIRVRLKLASAAHAQSQKHKLRDISKFILRSYLYPRHFQKMVNLFHHERRQHIFIRQPNYIMKCMIPFLHIGLSKSDVIQLLNDHHSWLETTFSRAAILKIHTDKLYLGSIHIDDENYQLTLSFDGRIRKEGELALSLEDNTGYAYYTLGFTIQNNLLLIGCMQGAVNDNGFSRTFTKAIHGLRPKSFMVEAVQFIAQYLDIKTIYAVKNSAHIYNAKRYGKKSDSINLDYDQLWQEHDGVDHNRWFYSLPLSAKRREMGEIKRPKRKMYRERYAWLDAYQQQLYALLQPSLLYPHNLKMSIAEQVAWLTDDSTQYPISQRS